MSEFSFIELIKQKIVTQDPHVIIGMGDDCAVLEYTDSSYLLATTDTLQEGVHFEAGWLTAEELGYKTLAVNLSDISAMGGEPRWALVSLVLPKSVTELWFDEFYGGVNSLARKHGVSLVGGNLSRSPGPMGLSMTVLGQVDKKNLKLRSGAKLGDHLFVTGDLGRAAYVLRQFQAGLAVPAELRNYFTRPEPQLVAGKFLGEQNSVTSMIDISDGLLADLGHLCEASQCGAKLDIDFDEDALHGGEDYQLLFTVQDDGLRQFNQQAQGMGFRRIGMMTEKSNNSDLLKKSRGYSHF